MPSARYGGRRGTGPLEDAWITKHTSTDGDGKLDEFTYPARISRIRVSQKDSRSPPNVGLITPGVSTF